MFRIRSTSHDPVKLHDDLTHAAVAIVDLETTGLSRDDVIVAAGILIDRDAHVLVTTNHRDLSSHACRVSTEALRRALSPLSQRRDLIAVFHNAIYDVQKLEQIGINVNCRIHDTMKLLKLLDNDRGKEIDDSTSKASSQPRFERRYKERMSYRLKDVARHLLNIKAAEFPGQVMGLPLMKLNHYLKSDLMVTRSLYDHLLRRLGRRNTDYNERLIVPITPILVRMAALGVQADPQFINEASLALLKLMDAIKERHRKRFGQALDVGDFQLRRWIYFQGLACRRIYSGKRRELSLQTRHLLELFGEQSGAKRHSLSLIHDYKLAQSLMIRLRALGGYIDPTTERIHSTFNDIQASGRISSTKPNLQQVAKETGAGQKKRFISDAFGDTIIKSRNAIIASPGFELVAFDIAQADIRVLAHTTEALAVSGKCYLDRLLKRRERRLGRKIAKYRKQMWIHFRRHKKKPVKCPNCETQLSDPTVLRGTLAVCPQCGSPVEIPDSTPLFDPTIPCELADDFRHGGTDFYTTATERMLGRKPKSGTPEREHFKQTILGIVNGMGAASIAKSLDVPVETAKDYLRAFDRAYSQTASFTNLMHLAFAITGEATTFAGRKRRVTAHWWLVNKPEIEIFISYKGADKLWLRVVPLQPHRHVLTCWVLRVIDAKYGSPNEGKEIYNDRQGRISQAPYRFFDDNHMVFGLPVRNVAWRIIRRVRTRKEEAVYEGFDRVRRQLFNHLCQGGTADVAKIMMLRADVVAKQFDARTLIQIHDELVFEVPKGKVRKFVGAMKHTLEQPPDNSFCVPIIVEPKLGLRFGEMRKLSPQEICDSWIERIWFLIRSWWRRLWTRT